MMKTRPPFDDETRRLDLLHRVNQIPGVSIPESMIGRRPSFPLSVLADEAALSRFLAVLDWVLDEIQAASDAGTQP